MLMPVDKPLEIKNNAEVSVLVFISKRFSKNSYAV